MQHQHDCGCGHSHEPSHRHEHHPHGERASLTESEAAFLDYLAHYRYLPVARFVTTSSREADFSVISLAPAFIQTPEDTLEQVREMGALLSSLEAGGHISIDYDQPLSGYAYDEFKQSALYAYFCETVAEAAKQEGFLGDTPMLELGSIAAL